MAKGSKEQHITKGGVVTPVEGFANDVTGNSPEPKSYGPHKGIGEQPFPVTSGGSPRGPYGGKLIGKYMRGKKAGA